LLGANLLSNHAFEKPLLRKWSKWVYSDRNWVKKEKSSLGRFELTEEKRKRKYAGSSGLK
jgi:hypothetical protein